MNDLAGKRALVIGGETSIGRVIAVGLAQAGADVALASLRNDTQAEFAINSALNEVWAIGRRGVALAIDASDAAQLRAAVASAEGELGGIDAVIVIGDASALGAALGERRLISIAPEAPADEALRYAVAELDARG
jgi:NAD(P)-dependent dehydrogenase (short-subunit alcohol dehydrogenase family)